METYIRLSSRFYYDKLNKTLTDMITGEIHSDKKDIEDILVILKDDKEFNTMLEKEIRKTFDLSVGVDKYKYDWKNSSWFIKIYRTEMREYKKQIRLTPNAGLLLVYFQDYIEYKTNRIVKKDGLTFTNKDIIKLIDVSENTVIKSLNELEEKYFIKRCGNKRAREIYFNPYLACSGNEIQKKTLDMFEEYPKLTPY